MSNEVTGESFVATVDLKEGARLFFSGLKINGEKAPDVYVLFLSKMEKRSMVLGFIGSSNKSYHVRFLGYYDSETTQPESSPTSPKSSLQMNSGHPFISANDSRVFQHTDPADFYLTRTDDRNEPGAEFTLADVDTGYWGLDVHASGYHIVTSLDPRGDYGSFSLSFGGTPAEFKLKLIGTYNPDGTIMFNV